jgi:hypothetical protein
LSVIHFTLDFHLTIPVAQSIHFSPQPLNIHEKTTKQSTGFRHILTILTIRFHPIISTPMRKDECIHLNASFPNGIFSFISIKRIKTVFMIKGTTYTAMRYAQKDARTGSSKYSHKDSFDIYTHVLFIPSIKHLFLAVSLNLDQNYLQHKNLKDQQSTF